MTLTDTQKEIIAKLVKRSQWRHYLSVQEIPMKLAFNMAIFLTDEFRDAIRVYTYDS